MSIGLLMKYFVLKPRGMDWHANASRVAMRAYAEAIKGHEPQLAAELLAWADEESSKAYQL